MRLYTGMDADADLLRELAAEYGVDAEYWDWRGDLQPVSADTLRAVLAAFEVDASSSNACRTALDAHRTALAERALPPCVVVRAGSGASVSLNAAGADARVRVELEGGGERQLAYGPAVPVPDDLPTGYHRFVAETDTERYETQLIVTPRRLPLPAGFRGPGWGASAQLYSVRSSRSWGVGDLGDLRDLATWTARAHGADFVLVNPLHAAEVVAPMNPSPYLPTTRRFANPLYLRVEDVPEYGLLSASVRAEVDRLGAACRAQQTADELIDRDSAWAAKRAALQIIHDVSRDAGAVPSGGAAQTVEGHGGLDIDRARAFTAFVAREGAELHRFATWCALSEAHGADWHDWPVGLHDPDSPEVAAAAEDLAPRIEFYRWLHWQLDGQLARAHTHARAAGMRLGVIHDVAVGVSASGADSWSWRRVLARDVTVGAPPDAYSQVGQDWEQPPWRPDRLAELAYAPLRELFRSALRHAGGLRVDHVIGLFRLWWIPAGRPVGEGAYVRYDPDALLGILALEAQRAGAVIIGEDLGNVDPRVRGYLSDLGLLGTSILWFEAEWGSGLPLWPDRWREHCLASVTTHDLPPTTGYLAGDHIRLRADLGLLTRSVDDELAEDRREKDRWRHHLIELGLLAPECWQDQAAIVVALHAFLTRTPALLRCAALTDAVGECRTQNQPGTRDEYPNWRIPLCGPDGRLVLLDDLGANKHAAAVFEAVRGGS